MRRRCWSCRKPISVRGPAAHVECQTAARERQRAKRAACRRKKICVRCQFRKSKRGRATCAECIAHSSALSAERVEARYVEGQCATCPRKRRAGRRQCGPCARAAAAYSSARQRVQRRVRGPDRTAGARIAKWKAKQRKKNRCTACGKPATWVAGRDRYSPFCARHLAMSTAARAKRRTSKP